MFTGNARQLLVLESMSAAMAATEAVAASNESTDARRLWVGDGWWPPTEAEEVLRFNRSMVESAVAEVAQH